jgi:hypothetical protein
LRILLNVLYQCREKRNYKAYFLEIAKASSLGMFRIKLTSTSAQTGIWILHFDEPDEKGIVKSHLAPNDSTLIIYYYAKMYGDSSTLSNKGM